MPQNAYPAGVVDHHRVEEQNIQADFVDSLVVVVVQNIHIVAVEVLHMKHLQFD